MTIERIKEIQKGTTSPDSLSLQQALMQVWNEVQQEFEQQLKERDGHIKELKELYRYRPHPKSVSKYILMIAELEAKLKRYENPVAEFEGACVEPRQAEVTYIDDGKLIPDFELTCWNNSLEDGKKYNIIVLEEGE